MKIDKEILEQMYINELLSKKEIAKRLSCSEGSIRAHIKKYQLKKTREQVNKTLNQYKIDKQTLDELYQNHSIREIKDITGLSINYIRKMIKEYNIVKSYDNIVKQHLEKIKQTNLNKYGTEYYTQTNDYKNRVKQTNLNKYGTEYYMSSDDFKKKSIQTCLQTYGNEKFGSVKELIAKRKQTNLNKYGAISPLLSKQYCGEFSNYSQTDKFKEQYKQRMIDRYGVDNFSKKDIKKEFRDIIYNKDRFIKFINDNNCYNPIEIANKLNVGHTLIYNKIIEYDLKDIIVYIISSYEKELRKYINQYFETENNTKKYLDGKEIDIYIPSKRIGIEFNGNYWHSEHHKDKFYHQNKSKIAEENDIFLYHIFEYEWNTKREQILNQINNLLGLNESKIYARKCVIKEVDNNEKSSFLELNHLQGNDRSSIKLGLYYDNELVSLMTFCKPRFNKNYEYELSRFCSKAGCNVIGGASRLFKAFIKTYNPKSIISYSNVAHTKGNLYKVLGMNLLQISEPNYVWCKGDKILTRYQCQKHKLLEQGFEGNSEVDIMHKRGYYRIYDCGNKVWIWDNIDNC